MSNESDPLAPSSPASSPPSSAGTPPDDSVVRAGEPAPPGSLGGRARRFRLREAEQRSVRRERVGQLIVAAIIVLGVYAIFSARPFTPGSGGSSTTPSAPITVSFASPILGNASCAKGGIAYTEKFVWSASSSSVTTGDIAAYPYELLDGDFIYDRGQVANVTASSLCAGSPPYFTGSWPNLIWSWYVVLTDPNGTVRLAYTPTQGWTTTGPGSNDVPIENGSALTVVTGVSVHDQGFGFAVVGYANGSKVTTSPVVAL